ncbi:MAG: cysteine hydrolase family protein [Telluria sp.]
MPASSPRRALIVIDVQNEYFTGALPIAFPDRAQSLAQIAAAMDGARAAGIPVIVVQNSAPAGSAAFGRGSDGWQLHAAVAARPRDHLVDKALPSAFAGTDLQAWLEAHAIDTLALVGYMTHNCVASTAIDATHRGYQVEILSDATGAPPYANRAGRASGQQLHETFLVVMESRFAAVLPARQWLELLGRGEASTRGSILASCAQALQS